MYFNYKFTRICENFKHCLLDNLLLDRVRPAFVPVPPKYMSFGKLANTMASVSIEKVSGEFDLNEKMNVKCHIVFF